MRARVVGGWPTPATATFFSDLPKLWCGSAWSRENLASLVPLGPPVLPSSLDTFSKMPPRPGKATAMCAGWGASAKPHAVHTGSCERVGGESILTVLELPFSGLRFK